jgi:hypothetical protein
MFVRAVFAWQRRVARKRDLVGRGHPAPSRSSSASAGSSTSTSTSTPSSPMACSSRTPVTARFSSMHSPARVTGTFSTSR